MPVTIAGYVLFMKTKYFLSHTVSRAKTSLLVLSIASLIVAAQAAPGASPAELLEKAIYSEETKGDLDAAMQLYQQVIAEAKAGQGVAAQAQYRLGVCYYKKQNYAEATAAFEKLVRDFPEQKELVTKASEYLARAAELLPAPWVDGEELQLDIKFPSGYKLGTIHYSADSGQTNGQKIWRLSSRLFAGPEQVSRVEVEADSFKPIHCLWKHSLMGDADTVYLPGHAELKVAGKDEVMKIDLQGVVYDNEEAVQLMRRLPLAENYKTSVPIFTGLGGGAIIPLGIEVTGREKVEVPTGTYDCYKVQLSLKQTFWYSTDPHRYLVKFEANGVVAELTAINQRRPGAPVKYQDPTSHFSLTAPAGWVFHRTDSKEEKGKSRVMLLDPEIAATSIVRVGRVVDLKPEAKKSVRDWAEQQAAEGSMVLKVVQIRPESWKERTVAGRPGVSVLGDFVEENEKKVGYAVFTLGPTNAAEFVLLIRAKDFEAFRPKFDAIVDSYTAD